MVQGDKDIKTAWEIVFLPGSHPRLRYIRQQADDCFSVLRQLIQVQYNAPQLQPPSCPLLNLDGLLVEVCAKATTQRPPLRTGPLRTSPEGARG